ncbi:hypothetical protein ACUXK8_002466, partial [Staphylococcus epidermidis]
LLFYINERSECKASEEQQKVSFLLSEHGVSGGAVSDVNAERKRAEGKHLR